MAFTATMTGRYDVRLISSGRGDFPGSMVFWGRDHLARHELDFQCVLITGEDRTVLVNTGFPEDLTETNATYSASMGTVIVRDGPSPPVALTRYGIRPEDVTDLVLTPLGLYTSHHITSFPNATIWMSQEGWDSFRSCPDHPHDRPETTLPADAVAYLTGSGRESLRLIHDDTTVAPGIRAWWTGGHHRASICLDIDVDPDDSGEGPRAIAVSDVYFHLRNFMENHPIGMSENIYEVLAAYRRIRSANSLPLPLFDPGNRVRFPGGVVCRRHPESRHTAPHQEGPHRT
ncbi:hypothetical protein KUG88_19955 [Rhodococcus rhodochrous]|uniref:hypothetical protein n=1 Tax=Rhodococcus rhodochrous TaxID=1829 RepID=UPI001E3E4460|nr:hypothetical protein [Rhodococcus rhodochrous]MCB8912402.1 hypothetical protein [Rhodococcus rhodochrous]